MLKNTENNVRSIATMAAPHLWFWKHDLKVFFAGDETTPMTSKTACGPIIHHWYTSSTILESPPRLK